MDRSVGALVSWPLLDRPPAGEPPFALVSYDTGGQLGEAAFMQGRLVTMKTYNVAKGSGPATLPVHDPANGWHVLIEVPDHQKGSTPGQDLITLAFRAGQLQQATRGLCGAVGQIRGQLKKEQCRELCRRFLTPPELAVFESGSSHARDAVFNALWYLRRLNNL